MSLIFNLSLRNLLRQKKRNLLLGMGVAFGMMILVIANSFSHGIVDVLLTDLVSNAFGHMVVNSTSRGSSYTVVRDKARIEKIIYSTIPKNDLISVGENLKTFGRAVGNGEADNIYVFGVNLNSPAEKKRFNDFYTVVAGDLKDYYRKDIEYPVIISQQKAKSLNVTINDVVQTRFPMVTGQVQAVSLTVVAIANANNTFMDVALLIDSARLKKLLGYKPWESAALQVTLKNPQRDAVRYANLIHEQLTPNAITVQGRSHGKSGIVNCQLVAFKNTIAAKSALDKHIRIIKGDRSKAFGKEGVMISRQMAQKLLVKAGDELVFRYDTKFRGSYGERFKVEAIYQSSTKLGANVLLVNEERIYEMVNRYLPASPTQLFSVSDSLYPVLATEWKILDRSSDSITLQKKYQQELKFKTKQNRVDVITMYEGASEVLKIEGVLNLITIIAVLILFFIILIGVINTLRMTIKERTREIGTMRAVGIQKNDVRNMFIFETLQLTAISCVVGAALGIVAIFFLGSIQFDI